jgi:hypothetical protein
MSVVGAVASRRFLRDGPIQPDLGYDLIPYLPALDQYDSYFLIVVAILAAVRSVFLKDGIIIVRRSLFIYSLCVLLRSTTSATTSLRDPSSNCQNFLAPQTPKEFFQYTISPPDLITCGDLLFSGHSLMYVSTAMLWTWYSHPLSAVLAWLVSLFGMFCLIAARVHYTDDVLIALFVNVLMWLVYHGFLNSTCTDYKIKRFIDFLEKDRIDMEANGVKTNEGGVNEDIDEEDGLKEETHKLIQRV